MTRFTPGVNDEIISMLEDSYAIFVLGDRSVNPNNEKLREFLGE